MKNRNERASYEPLVERKAAEPGDRISYEPLVERREKKESSPMNWQTSGFRAAFADAASRARSARLNEEEQ
jgi:hypothetical protein